MCGLMQRCLEGSEDMYGDGEPWSGRHTLAPFDTFDHILQECVVGWIRVLVLYVLEPNRGQVQFDCVVAN